MMVTNPYLEVDELAAVPAIPWTIIFNAETGRAQRSAEINPT
jgi:hypothetical protein